MIDTGITDKGLLAAAVYGILVLLGRVFAPYILERLRTENAQRLQHIAEDRAELETLRRHNMELRLRITQLEAQHDQTGTE